MSTPYCKIYKRQLAHSEVDVLRQDFQVVDQISTADLDLELGLIGETAQEEQKTRVDDDESGNRVWLDGKEDLLTVADHSSQVERWLFVKYSLMFDCRSLS
ncbi:MAG: hypothetical protein Q9176_002769 [Flavoplaca citrina]